MKRTELKVIEEALEREAVGRFREADLSGLPDPVRAYFRASIAVDTPLAQSARLRMRGRIKIGRWVPFRARQVLAPQHGFLWVAHAAGFIAGSDHYALGKGAMDWRLVGLVPVMHADGPDISRSAAGRAAAEAVWLPTALLPQFGVEWDAVDDTQMSARYHVEDHPVHVHYRLADEGRLRSIVFDRWGDPDDTGTSSFHPFGANFTDHATFHGLTVPTVGQAGWHYGTDRWKDGEFFHFRITNLTI